jgi:hypothetical protein
VDSANRSTPRDVELARFGRKGCGATARARTASAWELDPAAMSGCRADGRRSGSNELRCPNRRRRIEALARQHVRSPTTVGRAPLDAGSEEPVTGTACDRERQRPRYSVLLSQP